MQFFSLAKSQKKSSFDDDFYVDPFVNYFDDDSNCTNGHNEEYDDSKRQTNGKSSNNDTNQSILKCTVCGELVGAGMKLLQHVRTHTRMNSHPMNCYDSKVNF